MYYEDCREQLPDLELPPLGHLCPREIAFCKAFAESFGQQFAAAEHVLGDEFTEMVQEAAIVALQRQRVAARTNHAMANGTTSRGFDQTDLDDLDLTSRYEAALRNRWLKILQRLEEALDELLLRQENRRRITMGMERLPSQFEQKQEKS